MKPTADKGENASTASSKMKLRQGQVWKTADQYLRIVKLERLAVEYKAMKNLASKEGTMHSVTKKEFCRLLKTADLLSPAEEAAASKKR
jgi:hypothetical protein